MTGDMSAALAIWREQLELIESREYIEPRYCELAIEQVAKTRMGLFSMIDDDWRPAFVEVLDQVEASFRKHLVS